MGRINMLVDGQYRVHSPELYESVAVWFSNLRFRCYVEKKIAKTVDLEDTINEFALEHKNFAKLQKFKKSLLKLSYRLKLHFFFMSYRNLKTNTFTWF